MRGCPKLGGVPFRGLPMMRIFLCWEGLFSGPAAYGNDQGQVSSEALKVITLSSEPRLSNTVLTAQVRSKWIYTDPKVNTTNPA